MPSGSDFKYLLDSENVVGVAFNERTETVDILVSKKLDEDDLSPEDVVPETVEGYPTDVIDEGMGRDETGYTPETDHTAHHRPVPAGVSEHTATGTAATGGVPATLDETPDDETCEYDLSMAGVGDKVRISNCHVYAESNSAELGKTVVQPAPYDGGEMSDAVGILAGYRELKDGTTVDAAYRTFGNVVDEAEHVVDNPEAPVGVADPKPDDKVRVVGRSTGENETAIDYTNASIAIDYGGECGRVVLDDVVVTKGHITKGGDSGSPVIDADDNLVGVHFAGGGGRSISCKATNVEDELSVSFITQDTDDGDDDADARRVVAMMNSLWQRFWP